MTRETLWLIAGARVNRNDHLSAAEVQERGRRGVLLRERGNVLACHSLHVEVDLPAGPQVTTQSRRATRHFQFASVAPGSLARVPATV